MRILLVEDDDTIAAVLEKGLASEHYAVDVAQDGQMGWQLINAFDYDLVILDVVLPELDGIQLCQRLRDHLYHMPVLMLTALDSSNRKIAGLNAGADDYITKPFELDEILARIRVLLRRAQAPVLSMLSWGALQLNPNTQDVTYGDQALSLTPKEYRLLELFLRNQSRVFSRSAILDSLWNCEEAPGEDTVTAHMKGLRRKLTAVGAPPDLIKTVYGVGYRLKPLDADEARSAPVLGKELADEQAQAAPPAPQTVQQTKAALRSLWQSVKPQHEERLAAIKQAVEALAANQMTAELYHRAHRAAHNLKGALGVFGLPVGSELAQLIEQRLADRELVLPGDSPQLQRWIAALEREITRGPSSRDRWDAQPILPLLVLIDPDLMLPHDLAKAAKKQGLTTQVISDHRHLRLLRSQATATYQTWLAGPSNKTLPPLPDLGIFSCAIDTVDEVVLDKLSALVNQVPPLPVLIGSADGSLKSRIKAARLGHSTFLHNPDIEQILGCSIDLRSHLQATTAKVLVVDDDPHMLATLRTILEPWGVKLTTLEHAPQFWAILQRFSPDLLILDLEMPEFSGLDLCRVVRQTPAWHHLPIVFLSAHSAPPHQHAAMLAGANDYIDKSLTGSDLIKRLFNQLKIHRSSCSSCPSSKALLN
ncbi:response regulator [Nodosilinea sp. LEGE 07088]|uniref:response regulator n=1 Tax=Nodosilinea sp. LEGE 07088 TaxID=2777968 RepID=UPI00187E559F|nr:response regulator [Nodosilinea sp. LEGE 07088]MBE9138401.1 response regulator [Nodosilinea sp. LEGE 07088]